MLRALCAVSESSSILVKPPWANRWLLAGVTAPVLLHLGALTLTLTLPLPLALTLTLTASVLLHLGARLWWDPLRGAPSC